MDLGVDGTVGAVAAGAVAQVAAVVEQGDHDADDHPMGTEALGVPRLAFITVIQPRGRQADIEAVLGVVVRRVASEVIGVLSAEHRLEVRERGVEDVAVRIRIQGQHDTTDLGEDSSGLTHVHRVGDVVVLTSLVHAGRSCRPTARRGPLTFGPGRFLQP
jgi:hypothetical protein